MDPLPLLASNDSYQSNETPSSIDFHWTSDDFFTVMEMNRLLDEVQRTSSPERSDSLSYPSSLEDGGASPLFCCEWVGCITPILASLDDLVAHVMQDHVSSGKSSYACGWAGCSRGGRPFAKRHKIMTHIRSHTGERPFVCEKCGKRFARQDSLQTHMKVHDKKRMCHFSHPGRKQTAEQTRMLDGHECLLHVFQPSLPITDSLLPYDATQPEPFMDFDWVQQLSVAECLNAMNFFDLA